MTDSIEELAALASTLRVEFEEDQRIHQALLSKSGIQERRKQGLTWFPLRIVETGYGLGAYPYLVAERNPGDNLPHQFSSAAPVSLFSAATGNEEEVLHGNIGFVDDQRMKIIFRCDELPDWVDDGKLGVNLQFDSRTYEEMFKALNLLINTQKGRISELREIILGYREPRFVTRPAKPSALLNESQNEALQSIIESEDLSLVHGPPGTGKTTTLVEAIACLAAEEKTILVCAPSNAAVDHLTRSLAARGLKVVRVGNLARVDEDTTAHTLDVLLQNSREYKQIRELKRRALELKKMAGKYRRQFGREEMEQRKLLFAEARNLNREARETENYLVQKVLDDAQVITCTLIGSTHEYLDGRTFKTVVIDEAAQALEPACWVPILRAKRVVMAGDPFQLPPTVKSQEAMRKGLSTTLLEKAITRHKRVNLLKTQYRMHRAIMQFSNDYFYEGRLMAHESVSERLLSREQWPVEFIDTAGCGFAEQHPEHGESLVNKDEAILLSRHLQQIQQVHPGASVAVISPYRAQIEELKKHIQSGAEVAVNTIDSFQGQERDVVYLSLVRSNESGDLGFLKDYRRLNVAMTRARMKLVVIGDSATLATDRFFARLIEHFEQTGAYRSAWEFGHWQQ